MINIKELSIAYWRLEKWVTAAPVERKLAAESSLRTFKEYLEKNGITVIDLTGQAYDPGLSVEVMYFEDEDSKEDKTPIITEMMRPIIIRDGNVIEFGQVVIAKNPKKIEETPQAEYQPTGNTDDPKEESKESIIIPKNPKKVYLRIASIVFAFLIISCCALTGMIGYKTNNLIREMQKQNAQLCEHIEIMKNDILTSQKSEQEKETETHKNQEVVSWIRYVVKQGDTLISICNYHNLDYNSWEQIIKHQNGIEEANSIYAGQTILLPYLNEVK